MISTVKDYYQWTKNKLVSDITKIEEYFLKQVKRTLLEEYNLPWQCISIERHDDKYKMVYIMKEVPFEVYFNRYDVLDEVTESINVLSRVILNKKIFNLKVFVDYRCKSKNLLYTV